MIVDDSALRACYCGPDGSGPPPVRAVTHGPTHGSSNQRLWPACHRHVTHARIAIAHASNVVAHMGNIAHRVGNVSLHYDAERGLFDNPEANRLIKDAYRNGYEIPDAV